MRLVEDFEKQVERLRKNRDLKIYAFIVCTDSKVYQCEFDNLYVCGNRKLVYILDRGIKLDFAIVDHITYDE